MIYILAQNVIMSTNNYKIGIIEDNEMIINDMQITVNYVDNNNEYNNDGKWNWWDPPNYTIVQWLIVAVFVIVFIFFVIAVSICYYKCLQKCDKGYSSVNINWEPEDWRLSSKITYESSDADDNT